MEPNLLLKQMLEFNKTAFDNSFNAMLTIQEQNAKMVDTFVEQATCLPYLLGDVDRISFDGYERVRTDMGDSGVVGLCMNLPTLLTMWREPTEAAFYDYFEHHELLMDFVHLQEQHLVRIAEKIAEME